MPWARFDDRFPSNRKVRLLSDGAFRLYVSAICWSAENLTDGVIKTAELRLVADVRATGTRAKELVEHELWETLPGVGWRIHDYHEYNPTAEQVRADRAAKTARQQRWRAKGKSDPSDPGPAGNNADVDASTDPSHDASRDGTRDAAPRARVPGPSRPDPTPKDRGEQVGAPSVGSRRTSEQAHTHIPADFTPSTEATAWAQQDGHTQRLGGEQGLRTTTAAFIDWHTAKGTTTANPDALWRKWIRDQRTAPGTGQGAFLVGLPGGATPTPPSYRERMAQLDAAAARDRDEDEGETG